MKRLIIAAAILAALAAASAQAAPQPANDARICWAWRNTCVRYVYVFGRPVCTAHQLTCIKWL